MAALTMPLSGSIWAGFVSFEMRFIDAQCK
jgi:hypothetical protein